MKQEKAPLEVDAVQRKVVLLVRDVCADQPFHDSLTHLVANENVEVEEFLCADAWIWNPYGSFMRTLLVRAYQLAGVCDIWVVGSMTQRSKLDLSQALHRERVLHTATYLLQHHFNVNPDAWYQTGHNQQARIQTSARLIQEHSLLPRSVQVLGYAFDPEQAKFQIVWPAKETLLTDGEHVG